MTNKLMLNIVRMMPHSLASLSQSDSSCGTKWLLCLLILFNSLGACYAQYNAALQNVGKMENLAHRILQNPRDKALQTQLDEYGKMVANNCKSITSQLQLTEITQRLAAIANKLKDIDANSATSYSGTNQSSYSNTYPVGVNGQQGAQEFAAGFNNALKQNENQLRKLDNEISELRSQKYTAEQELATNAKSVFKDLLKSELSGNTKDAMDGEKSKKALHFYWHEISVRITNNTNKKLSTNGGIDYAKFTIFNESPCLCRDSDEKSVSVNSCFATSLRLENNYVVTADGWEVTSGFWHTADLTDVIPTWTFSYQYYYPNDNLTVKYNDNNSVSTNLSLGPDPNQTNTPLRTDELHGVQPLANILFQNDGVILSYSIIIKEEFDCYK